MTLSRNPEDFRDVLVSDLVRIAGKGVGAINVTPLPRDASLRRYYRVTSPELPSGPVEENSLVVMVLADPDPANLCEEIIPQGFKREKKSSSFKEEDLDFVNVCRHFEKVNLPIPRLYLYNIEWGILYLEDLGDCLLEKAQLEMSDEEKKKMYHRAIEHMLKIHEKAGRVENPHFVGFSRAFDQNLLYRELMHFVEYGVEAREGVKVESDDLEVIQNHMKMISDELARQPKVLVHRDYQSRNLLIKNGELCIIDFQDALMGTRQYDLVSLLRDSYVVLPDEIIDDCISLYCNQLENSAGEKIDREHFMRIFHLQALQRKLKDAGRFDYIDIVKKNSNFLRYIPDTLNYVKDAFQALPEHRPMQERLAKYKPELAP